MVGFTSRSLTGSGAWSLLDERLDIGVILELTKGKLCRLNLLFIILNVIFAYNIARNMPKHNFEYI